jgi:hypothetical protein
MIPKASTWGNDLTLHVYALFGMTFGVPSAIPILV